MTDEEAAKITEAVDAAGARLRAEQAQRMDAELLNFRRERDIGRTTPGHMYYADPLAPPTTVSDPTGKVVSSMSRRAEVEAMLEETETSIIAARLEMGLPAEPAPRQTPAQLAQARYDARHKASE